VYRTPDGLYKYLQTISIYLTMPVAPAIFFGIMSKRVTPKGAFTSVFVGSVLVALFVTDQLVGVDAGSRYFRGCTRADAELYLSPACGELW